MSIVEHFMQPEVRPFAVAAVMIVLVGGVEIASMLIGFSVSDLLGQTAHILAALAERLGRRQSSYKAVFDALVAIAAEAPQRDIVDELLKAPDADPMDLVALDAAWEEEEVRFGPGAQGQGACGHESLIAKLRHARRAVDPAPSSLQ